MATWPITRAMPSIRHLRLEQVELDKLHPTHFDLPMFENLKVLVLYPWTFTSKTSNGESRLPNDEHPEGKLLRTIVDIAPTSLRVIFVGAYRVWLRRNQNGIRGSEVQPLPLSKAKVDNDEIEIMRKKMTADHWEFTKDVPSSPVRDLSLEARKTTWGSWSRLSRYIIQERSYLLLKHC